MSKNMTLHIARSAVQFSRLAIAVLVFTGLAFSPAPTFGQSCCGGGGGGGPAPDKKIDLTWSVGLLCSDSAHVRIALSRSSDDRGGECGVG